MKTDQVLQIRIELLGIRPGIWRRIQIEPGCTFWDLHVAIQDAMGWTDSHLHLFEVEDPDTGRERLIGLTTEDDELGMEPGWEHEVTEVLSIQRPRVIYEYDFGDSWEHAVVLEDVLPVDARADYPRCVAGARACPPEDVGGVYGYAQFLEAIADPGHEEHDSCLRWAGGVFDPERFDASRVRFRDPEERWHEVYGGTATAGASVAGPPQVEGGFTGEEIQRLLLSPFADDSPLNLETDLPDEAFEAAPLVRDVCRFLQVLAEEAPLKLTQKGNLPRATITRLIEAEALGSPWWWEFKTQLNERHAPRATLLRGLADLAGMTRKRHGKLELTKRGRDVVEGRLAAGELYRMLMDRHVTKYNWASADGYPESRWLQGLFWYALFLLAEHGDEKRSSMFYGERLALAFPFVMQDFAVGVRRPPSDALARAFELRVLRRFAVEFGLAVTSTGPDDISTEPCHVWAGPLLRVVNWRRGAGAETAATADDRTRVVAGPWAQDVDEALREASPVADPTIAEVLAAFLGAQRRRLRSQQTIRKYEQVVELLQKHLDADGHQLLPDGDLAAYDLYSEEGPAQRTFCEVFGPEWIPPHLGSFQGYFLVCKVTATPALVKAAGTVCRKLLAWLEAEGLLE